MFVTDALRLRHDDLLFVAVLRGPGHCHARGALAFAPGRFRLVIVPFFLLSSWGVGRSRTDTQVVLQDRRRGPAHNQAQELED